jgi:hypothetical protein
MNNQDLPEQVLRDAIRRTERTLEGERTRARMMSDEGREFDAAPIKALETELAQLRLQAEVAKSREALSAPAQGSA